MNFLYGLVLVVHLLVSFVLIVVILLQGGRGGLSEALGGSTAQSLFGSNTATVMTRLTTACAGLFVVTCLSLAYLSSLRGRSVIEQLPAGLPQSLPVLPGNRELPSRPQVPATTPATPSPQESSSPSR